MNTKTKHTPGPWMVETDGTDDHIKSASRKESPYVLLANEGICGKDVHEAVANARLIASAPELLEIVQNVRVYGEAISHALESRPETRAGWDEIMSQIRGVKMEITGKKYRELPDDGTQQDYVMSQYEAQKGDIMTTKTQHTPGPWTYSVTNEGNIGSKDKVRVDAADGHIAIACRIKKTERNTFGPVGVRRNLPEVKANARLIAAAPDLLAALKALVKLNEDNYGPCIEKDTTCCQNCAARAAIAKAGGR